jgi:acyl carrier protein
MRNVEQRLAKCFSAVFPELSWEEIVKVNSNTAGAWDSLNAVTLMALIQEEFGIELAPDGELENMSFQNMMARVAKVLESRIPTAPVSK